MEGGSSFVYVTVVLTLIWLGLIYNPNLSVGMFIEEFFAGFVIALGVSFLTHKNFKGLGIKYFNPRRIAYFIAFLFVFLKEMIKANLHMARIVLSPSLPINPGIVEIETKLKQPSAKLFLGNAITLTPGTMTIDYDDSHAYIHWVDIKSTEIEKAGDIIKGKFEKLLKGVYS